MFHAHDEDPRMPMTQTSGEFAPIAELPASQPRNTLGYSAIFCGVCVLGVMFCRTVPKWDAEFFYGWLLKGVNAGLDIPTIDRSGHISFGYLLPLAVTQLVDFRGVEILNLSNVVLFLLSLLAFSKTLKLLDGKLADSNDRLFVTAIYAFLPAIQAHIYHLTPDFGVLIYFTWALCFLLQEKFICAALCALPLVFAKETGAFVYAGMIGCYYLTAAAVFPERIKTQARKTAAQVCVLAMPLVVYASYLTYEHFSMQKKHIWYTDPDLQQLSLFDLVFDVNPNSPSMRVELANIFLVNFNWLMTAVILIALMKLGYSRFRKRISRETTLPRELYMRRCFMVLLMLCTLYVVTRYRHCTHVRYIMSMYPLLLAVMYFSLRSVFSSATLRMSFLAITLLATGISNSMTVDPLSRKVFGTLRFGHHRLLNTGRYFTRDAPNNDAQIYNLEYLVIDRLTDAAFADIRPSENYILMGPRLTNYFWPGRLDNATSARTARAKKSYFPISTDQPAKLLEFESRKALPVAYFEWPNIVDPGNLDWLKIHYRSDGAKTYSMNGYQLRVDFFTPRP